MTWPASPRQPATVTRSSPRTVIAAFAPVPSAAHRNRFTSRPAPSVASASVVAARSGTTVTGLPGTTSASSTERSSPLSAGRFTQKRIVPASLT
jgi:hypothetical protein